MTVPAIEPLSPTWRAVSAWAAERIEQYRLRLENPGLPPAETENLRGAIRELRVLVALPSAATQGAQLDELAQGRGNSWE
jgi:hypothetical protein